ncbi:hypothetical protein H0H81_009781 [Sphagnurus paluster]|uniref:F-box domain-containing protein n=1 Tax=Sphagnurus paluster TaxID=117069 RepID=A0A9P7K5J8_9AGAR|nr:hypothetical protein H0H81_009781 [Sphagnurus paluster]
MNISYSYKRKNRIELLDTWLKRSGTCPLSINLLEHEVGMGGRNLLPELRALQTEIATLLVSQSHRWKAIDLHFSRKLPSVLGQLNPGSLPILESAKVESCDPMRTGAYWEEKFVDLDNFWNTIHASPLFRNAHWDIEYCCHQYRHQRLRNVPWKQLTTMDVAMPVDFLLEIIPFCQNLTDLHFTDHRWTHPLTARGLSLPDVRLDSPIILPRLRNLSLSTTVSTDVVLENLTLPSLISFSLHQSLCGGMVNPKPSTFENLLARSNCRLQKYSYDYSILGAGGEDILLEILGSLRMSFLIDLTVCGSREMRSLIPFLIRLLGDPAHLPNLTRLTIADMGPLPAALEEIALSRLISLD